MLETRKKLNIDNSIIKILKQLLGKDNVLTDYEECYCYSFDAAHTGNDIHLPDIVVLPETTEHVSEIVRLANKYSIPVLARGAGTNHAGGCVPLKGGIVIHTSKMNRIINIDRNNLVCTVQPGVVVEKLQQKVEDLERMHSVVT